MVIESWLGDVTPRESRGTVLAVYSVISLVGLAIGQLLMGIGFASRSSLFAVAAMLLALAIVPVGLTRIQSPRPVPAIQFRPGALLEASRVAVVCAGLAGLVTGAFWSLGPLLGESFGINASFAGLLMSLGIAGGAICHLPVGRLSDRHDRRLIIAVLAGVGAVVGVTATMLISRYPPLIYLSFLLIGAASMPLYSLCIALACDQSDLSLVEATGSILLINGFGSILGPLMASALIAAFGPGSYFAFCAVCLSVVAVWTTYRRLVVERHPEPDSIMDAAVMPRTTQAVTTFTDETAHETGE